MEGNEYKDNEKVLYKTTAKVSLPHKKLEETNCIVTEHHIVVQAEETIKIPLSRIQNCVIVVSVSADGSVAPGTVTLKYLDSTQRRRTAQIETHPAYYAGMLKSIISGRLGTYGKIMKFAEELKDIGVDLELVYPQEEQEREFTDSLKASPGVHQQRMVDRFTKQLGYIRIYDTHVNKINITKTVTVWELTDSWGTREEVNINYAADFEAAIEQASEFSCSGQPKKRFLFFGGVIDYGWHGGELAEWLAQDTQLSEMLRKANAPSMEIAANHIYIKGKKLPSGELFPCIDRIAEYICKKV